MKEQEIINGNKIIANYLGYKYIPFNDLQGFPKAGWYKVNSTIPTIKKVKFSEIDMNKSVGKNLFEGLNYEEKEVDINLFKYSKSNGWSKIDNYYFKYICRTSKDLKFYNSLDALLPVIKKLEKEENLNFSLYNNGAQTNLNPPEFPIRIAYNFNKDYIWVQNVFKVVIKTIEYINEKIHN